MDEQIEKFLKTKDYNFEYFPIEDKDGGLYKLVLDIESFKFTLFIWYNERAQAIKMLAPTIKLIYKKQFNDAVFMVMDRNNKMYYGNFSLTPVDFDPNDPADADYEGGYWLMYNHAISMKRGEDTEISFDEFNEYFLYMSMVVKGILSDFDDLEKGKKAKNKTIKVKA